MGFEINAMRYQNSEADSLSEIQEEIDIATEKFLFCIEFKSVPI